MDNMENKSLNERFFDDIFSSKSSAKYKFDLNGLGYRDIRILNQINKYNPSQKYCLDIGPGTGRWIRYLRSKNAKFIAAIDLSSEALKKCENIADRLVKMDVEKEKFDFPNDHFDIIFCFMVLEHIREPENLLKEISRVAKKDSLILITIPNILSFTSRIRMLLGFLPVAITSDETHVKFYNKRSLTKLLERYGLNIEILPTSISLNPVKSKSLRISSNRVLASLDDHILFRARKK